MFCDACGASMQPGQAYCGRCGKQIIGPVGVARPSAGRVERHTHLLSILWLAVSALNILGGFVLLLLGHTLFPHLRAMKDVPPEAPFGFLSSLMIVLGIFVLGKAACGFLTGWGLMKHESWARVVALVLAFISLFNIPFGTAIGVYTMWVLLPAESQKEYDSLAEARAA